jgi:hypothetical protein
MTTKFNIREILHGTQPGALQSVGLMQVIPLILTVEPNTHFATPHDLLVGVSGHYGHMEFTNKTSRPGIIPMHTTVITEQRVQDHAMTKAGFVAANKNIVYNDAVCVQSSQGGYLERGEHEISILPYALRETALSLRGKKEYNKLWPAIADFNKIAQVAGGSCLVYFVQKFTQVLDQFVAEFECEDNQVGAIILVDGVVLGVERAPSVEYWNAVWEPLVRLCYGSQAIIVGLDKSENAYDGVYQPIREASSLEDLASAVRDADQLQFSQAREIVRGLIDDQFSAKEEESHVTVNPDGRTTMKIHTVEHDQFAGQVVTDDGMVAYASLFSRSNWKKKRSYRRAEAFAI